MPALSRTVSSLIATVAFFTLLPERAQAYPFLAPRPVPSAIAGPTDPHVAAIFYNPAALGPLRGVHLYLEGGPRLSTGSIERADGQGKAAINWADFDGFAGLTWDLQTDSFTVGLASYAPFTDLTRYEDRSVAYHAISHTMITVEQTIAAAFKISNAFFIGASANFAETWLDYRYLRDAALDGGSALVSQPNALCGGAACGYENPLAAQQVHLRGFGWGIGFSVGVLVRPIDRLWLALSYVSHIFNPGQGGDFPLRNPEKARIWPSTGQGPLCGTLADGSPGACPGNDLITVALPDILTFGVRVELSPRIDLEGSARWVRSGAREDLGVHLQGAGVQPLALPPEWPLDRGFQDAFAFEVSGRFRLGERIRLAPSLVYETAAVDASAVNAASIDAHKLDVALTAEWRPTSHFRLGLHFGVTPYLLGEAGGRFDPAAQVACVDAHYALSACGPTNRGDGLPSARGTYTYVVAHAGASLGLDF